MDKLAKDDSFALGVRSAIPKCDSYQKCEVVRHPLVVDRSLGGGWMFPKRSAFFPIFRHYVGLVKEGGSIERMMESRLGKKNLPDQECPNYEGDPIAMKKAFSLFAIIFGGIGLSLIIFL